MKKKILIIDDDEKLTGLIAQFLTDFGFQPSMAPTPSQGMKILKRIEPDLVILDIMLPEIDGFEVCRRIRLKSNIPIIMLTARGELTDRIVGLEIGADDYLAKPFEPRELVARINTVLRRAQGQKTLQNTQKFGDLHIDHNSRKGVMRGRDLKLTTNEFTVLALLCNNPGKVFDRDEILQELKGLDSEAFNRTVDITISRLRQKLEDDPKDSRFIKTVWGMGYSFIGTGNEPT